MTTQLLATPEQQALSRLHRDQDEAARTALIHNANEHSRHNRIIAEASRAAAISGRSPSYEELPTDTQEWLRANWAAYDATMERIERAGQRHTERMAALHTVQRKADEVAEMLGDELPSVTRQRLNNEIDSRSRQGLTSEEYRGLSQLANSITGAQEWRRVKDWVRD